MSKAEDKIKKYLIIKQIEYKQEYIFNDLINPDTNQHLRFDFYLPKLNICIEYDGKQHYKYIPDIHGLDPIEGLRLVKKQQMRDKIKNNYCSLNNIKLIRLNSSHYYRINEVLNKRLKND